MASVLRPRFDVVLVLAGVRHELHSTIRDTIGLKAMLKGAPPTGDPEDVAKVIYLACQRTGLFAGTWDEFLDAVDDFEVFEPPPLASAAGSPDSSPPSPEPPASPPESLPG